MKKNTETLWTDLKLRKSQASVSKMFTLPIFWKNQKNIQQLLSGQLLAGGKNFYSESYCNMHIPNLYEGGKLTIPFYFYFPLLVSNRSQSRKTVEMKLHQINCLFAKM
jgi:hypothetical protein